MQSMESTDDLDPLSDAIRSLHGCASTWTKSVPVHETFKGETIWQGEVEVFKLHGHPEAETAYAWSHLVGEKTGRRKFIAVLGIPPINSAVDAVRAAIAGDNQE